MRGDDGEGSLSQETEQDGVSQRGALRRVGIGAQFVQEYQAFPGSSVDNTHDITHVPAET